MKQLSWNLLLALALLITSVTGQNELTNETKTSLAFDEQKVLLIDEILFESSQLKSDKNQIFVFTLMIDLLWEKDENTARQLAEKSASILRSKLVLPKDTNKMIRYFPYKYDSLRHDLLVTIAKYDIALAKELKNKTQPKVFSIKSIDKSQQQTLNFLLTKERDLEQKMAFQIAANDLQKAEKLANESLDRGISHMALNTLVRFKIKDIDLANRFADNIIDKLSKVDFKNNRTAVGMTSNFIFQMNEKNGRFRRILKCDNPIYCSKPLTVNQNKFRNLASKWLNYTLNTPDNKIGYYFPRTTPILLKLLPKRGKEINDKLESIKKSQPRVAEYRRLREKSFDKKTPPAEIAKVGINKSDQERFTYYRFAFRKATNHSKEALKILLTAVSKHPDSEEKTWLINSINRHIAGKTADEGNLDKALELSYKITKKDMRTSFLTFLARKYLETGNEAKAIILTDEITNLLDLNHKDKLPRSIVSYDKFSNIFTLFALINPERAFLLLETVLPNSNEYFAKNFGKSNGQEIDLKLLISRHRWLFTSYSKPIRRLAEADFEQTRKLIRYFERPELSVAAKVLILKALSDKEFVFKNYADGKEKVYDSN